MRYVKSLIFSAIMLAGLFTMDSFALSQYYPLTASQNHFTHIITQLKTFRSVEWESPISMWVQIPSSQSGRAAELADTIEDRGRSALFQPFCVHIYATKGKELAKSCVY